MQNFSPRQFDEARAFRAFFADRWSGFLRDNFRSAEHVAVAFGVTFQTASNWWQGIHRPTGDVVARAAILHPETFTASMRRSE